MKELYPGDQGIWVQYLQLALQRAGQQVMLDGIFGPKTCAAVEKVMGSSGKCAVKEAQWNRLLPFLRGYITHEVKAGDTFFSIAKMYDTTMERVMHANPGTDAGALQIGSTVVVPFTLPCLPGGSSRACRHVIPICRWERSEEVLWEHPCGRCSWEMVR